MPQVFIAGGSNIEPERNLGLAADELEREFPGIHFSPWYRNASAGFVGDDFINFVAGFETELPVNEVIERLRRIEGLCGRPREAPKWAPRTMDLDLLLYGDLICESLRLPRPDLLKRAYMLGPLADLAPDLVHPVAKLTIGELWARFDRASHPLRSVPRPTSPRSGHRPPPGSGP